MNIPIRTTVVAEGELRFYAGGGIVADSSPESEFEETEVKVAAIRRALSRFAVPAPPDPEKSVLRRKYIEARDALFAQGSEAFSKATTERLRALPEYRAAKVVLATLSIGTEWDTRPFAEAVLADGKMLVLPRVVKKPRSLELYAVRELGADLKAGVWGIEEPDPERCERVTLADVQLALVPALAVDREGYRLGYGAGYFDRLLGGSHPGLFRVVALPAPLVVERLPREAHDVAVDAVMTEEKLLRIPGRQQP
jgi:5-formyltetrahydrofolate cyclo-ligase